MKARVLITVADQAQNQVVLAFEDVEVDAPNSTAVNGLLAITEIQGGCIQFKDEDLETVMPEEIHIGPEENNDEEEKGE